MLIQSDVNAVFWVFSYLGLRCIELRVYIQFDANAVLWH